MRYETIFILDPTIDPTRIINIIKSNMGQIINEEHLGIKTLAYISKGHDRGYYVHILHKTDDTSVVENVLKESKEVLKYMIIKEDK